MLKPKLIEELKKLNFPSEGSVAELKLRLNKYCQRKNNTHDDDNSDNDIQYMINIFNKL